jgi:hypothetical protein
MNLHGIVRGAITTVNKDVTAMWSKSTGNTPNADFSQTPTYATAVPIQIQHQALSGGDLKHADALGLQGILRTVYMYGNKQGVVRPSQQGGDLLTFPLVPNGPTLNWLVVEVGETWPDWCKVTVCLQA